MLEDASIISISVSVSNARAFIQNLAVVLLMAMTKREAHAVFQL